MVVSMGQRGQSGTLAGSLDQTSLESCGIYGGYR